MIDSHDYDLLIVAVAGVIVVGVIIGLVVMVRRLSHRLVQREDAFQQLQRRAAELDVDRATLEAHVQRIPVLEEELGALKSDHAKLQGDLRQVSAALAKAQEKGAQLEAVLEEKRRQREQLGTLQNQNAQLMVEAAELNTLLADERKQATEKISLLNEARDQLKNEFQNLANQIFEEKSHSFAEQNRLNMDHLITPLRDQIGDFKKRVEDVYDKESRDRASLQGEIRHLKELNQRIGKEALNLTRALKGDSKARGNWGEVVLERVLEVSGLQKGREYETQVSLKDQHGKRYQPDVIVRLPQGKDVVVDAKVSLNDYEVYYTAEDPGEKDVALKAHIDSIRNHIRSLASKRYEDLEGVRSLDFVLMFVPIEAAFLAAVERDRELFSEAFEKNIMVVSPSTLLVTLRTIENIWRYEYQNRHAFEIAKKAGGLYDKFVGFVDALREVGRQLDRAKSAYQTASDRLADGRGNLIRRTQELKSLGVKAGKELPQDLLEIASEEEATDD